MFATIAFGLRGIWLARFVSALHKTCPNIRTRPCAKTRIKPRTKPRTKISPKEHTVNIDLTGKVALVTGASSGLGARFARVLAESGATVAVAARRLERLKELRAEIDAAGGEAHVYAMDVTDVQSIQSTIAKVELDLKRIDIVINNSGVSATGKLTDVTADEYDYIFNTNTKGAFFVAQQAAKVMIAKKTQGRIVNIASVAGLRVLAQIGVYCMSKAAVVQMTKAMALEWGRYGINTNAICPGYIETEINSAYFNSDSGEKLKALLPRRRVGKPEDLDGVLLMLCADQSGFINGSVIAADDGLSVS
jgi:NAD(P)-dependent dehydrogenase (short-subunit alcohol dehydrogenase family)